MNLRGTAFAIVAAILVGACTESNKGTDVRHWTDDLAVRISVDPMPPRAQEQIVYKVIVTDKKSNQPIDTGEGRIFATSHDGASASDGLAKGKEVGTYYARLSFITSGDWAIALQFRRDTSNRRTALQRMDWIQSVAAPTPGN
ncbi:MAG: hypothetical protein H0W69_06060 [Gemmatimonadaceae bacterium]|nr:hypothetical protein [Gemmatimonadaceae bacterium]